MLDLLGWAGGLSFSSLLRVVLSLRCKRRCSQKRCLSEIPHIGSRIIAVSLANAYIFAIYLLQS